MVDFDAIKEAAAKKMEEAVYDSVRDLTLALMQDDEFCRPLENMERRDSAKCKLAMHVIFEYLRQATALMAKDVWNVMEVVANLSVWPETKDEVKPEEALERLKSLYDAARTIRAGRNDVNFLFQGMIEDLMDLERLVFLRRCAEPDKPWYTLEVSPKRIVQCEGARRNDGKAGYYGHLYRDDLPEDAKAFLDAWEAKVCRAEKKHDERKDIA